MNYTKYDRLTIDELLRLAYADLPPTDNLGWALFHRLGEVQDELAQTKQEYDNEMAWEDKRYNELDERYIDLKKKYEAAVDTIDIEGVPV